MFGCESVLSTPATLLSTSSSSFAQVASSASSCDFSSAILSSKNLACLSFSLMSAMMSTMSLYSSIFTNTGALSSICSPFCLCNQLVYIA